LQVFQEEWKKKFNWELFKPLPKEDVHHFKTLRIPLTNEQKEFDEQVLSLTKILIDSLNEKELKKRIKITKENTKGIDKLESFLNSEHVRFKGMLEFLRDLQELRSAGVAHIKGKKYNKIKKAFLIGEKNLSDVFDNILVKAIQTLNSLESYFQLFLF
jgi:Cft2 family RNA processing exonuclease